MTRTYTHWPRGVAATVAAALALVLAAHAAPDPAVKRPAAPLPAPRGEVIGAAEVCVISRRDHGDPDGVPFASVSGAYRLTGFPYAGDQRASSVLFFRDGHAPHHVSVTRPQRGAPGPRLGKAALVPLPARMGCVAGLLIERDAGGVARYRSGQLTATVAGEDEPVARIQTRQDGFFRRALTPGRYRIAVTDGEASTVEVAEGETTFLVFERAPRAPAAPAND